MPTRSAELAIVGAGLAGLCAALSAVRHGITPLILEERAHPGGLVACEELAGIKVDVGADSFPTRSPAVSSLARQLGLDIVAPAAHPWVWHEGACVPIPLGIFGIPARLDDPSFTGPLVAAGGADALERAKRDLAMSPTIGSTAEDIASLASTRLGQTAVDVFVEPFARAIHGVPAKNLRLEEVAPGLRERMAEYGSLTAAVHSIRPEPVSRMAHPRGGMFRLVDALCAEIEAGGGTIETSCRATSLVPGSTGGWELWHEPTDGEHPTGEAGVIHTPAIILATPMEASLRLLGSAADGALIASGTLAISRASATEIVGLVDSFPATHSRPMVHVLLALRNEALDQIPRGSGVAVAPPSRRARIRPHAAALTHVNAQWPDSFADAPPHSHLLRLSYRGLDYAQTLGEDPVSRALVDASILLGIDVHQSDVLDSRVSWWQGAPAHHMPDMRAAVDAITAALGRVDGLSATGAWMTGPNLDAVVAHALACV